jgi:glycolate oxidase iron-sulfur subunit
MDVNSDKKLRDDLLQELACCRACRFCVDVCPTYQASEGIETYSPIGRLQTLRYLLTGMLELDDAMTYALYSCLQCKRCEVVCGSKGQNLNICEIITTGRALLSKKLIQGGQNAKL